MSIKYIRDKLWQEVEAAIYACGARKDEIPLKALKRFNKDIGRAAERFCQAWEDDRPGSEP